MLVSVLELRAEPQSRERQQMLLNGQERNQLLEQRSVKDQVQKLRQRSLRILVEYNAPLSYKSNYFRTRFIIEKSLPKSVGFFLFLVHRYTQQWLSVAKSAEILNILTSPKFAPSGSSKRPFGSGSNLMARILVGVLPGKPIT